MRLILLSALLALAACTRGSEQANTPDNAADQSTSAAAAILENRADAIRDKGAVGAPGDPGSTVQNAMQDAGEAQDGVKQAPAPGPKPTVSPDR